MKKRAVALLLCLCVLFGALFSSCGYVRNIAKSAISAAVELAGGDASSEESLPDSSEDAQQSTSFESTAATSVSVSSSSESSLSESSSVSASEEQAPDIAYTYGAMTYTLPANWAPVQNTDLPQFILPGNCSILTVSDRPQPQPISSLADAKPQLEQCAKDMLVELTSGNPGDYEVQNFAVSQTGDTYSAEFDLAPAAPNSDSVLYTVRVFAQGSQLYRMVFLYKYPQTDEVRDRIEKAVILIIFNSSAPESASAS